MASATTINDFSSLKSLMLSLFVLMIVCRQDVLGAPTARREYKVTPRQIEFDQVNEAFNLMQSVMPSNMMPDVKCKSYANLLHLIRANGDVTDTFKVIALVRTDKKKIDKMYDRLDKQWVHNHLMETIEKYESNGLGAVWLDLLECLARPDIGLGNDLVNLFYVERLKSMAQLKQLLNLPANFFLAQFADDSSLNCKLSASEMTEPVERFARHLLSNDPLLFDIRFGSCSAVNVTPNDKPSTVSTEPMEMSTENMSSPTEEIDDHLKPIDNYNNLNQQEMFDDPVTSDSSFEEPRKTINIDQDQSFESEQSNENDLDIPEEGGLDQSQAEAHPHAHVEVPEQKRTVDEISSQIDDQSQFETPAPSPAIPAPDQKSQSESILDFVAPKSIESEPSQETRQPQDSVERQEDRVVVESESETEDSEKFPKAQQKSLDEKPEEELEEKAEEKQEEKIEEKPEEKLSEKQDEKTEEKPEETTEKKPEEKTEDIPVVVADKQESKKEEEKTEPIEEKRKSPVSWRRGSKIKGIIEQFENKAQSA